MSIVTVSLLGRTGNQMFQYAHARAYAEKHGHEFRCDPWIGQRIFQLEDKPPPPEMLSNESIRRTEMNVKPGEDDICFRTYAQRQRCVDLYTRAQVKKWFRLRPEILKALSWHQWSAGLTLAHRRVGDYAGYGYPVVSKKSYYDAARKFNLQPPHAGWEQLYFVTEDSYFYCPGSGLPEELSFLPDFFRLMRAAVLLRGNSCFSWWAATLADESQEVYAPVIEGKEGGKEHDCEFVPGNWPRFANLEFVENLHLAAKSPL